MADEARKGPQSTTTDFSIRTIYDELAEIGELDSFLREYLSHRYASDKDFQEKMYDTMFRNSPSVVPALESFLLEKLCESMGFFLEYTKPCKKLNPEP